MKTMLYGAALMATSALLFRCSTDTKTTDESGGAQKTAQDYSIAGATDCNIALENIHFTKSLNGADTLAIVKESGKIEFHVGEKKDYFSDPDGKLSNNSAPILLSEVDNTKPFTITAKVTPHFTETGLYDAGVLYIFVSNSLYQKFCFEQDERGQHRIVTVRTQVTSDDNNHDIVTQPFVYMKISSDTKTVASFYSLDNKNWQMVRLYRNEYPKTIWLGISAQCPVGESSVSDFEQIKLEQKSVANFRLGE